MALPPGITPKTVNIGIASFFDGTLAKGRVMITAPVNVVHTPSNRPIFSGAMTKQFVDGEASFELCPTDAAGLNRVDWTYKLNVEVSGALVQPTPMYFTLPAAGPDTVDLDGLVTVPGSSGTPISVDVLTAGEIDPLTAGFIGDGDSETRQAMSEALAAETAAGTSPFAVAQRAAFGRTPPAITTAPKWATPATTTNLTLAKSIANQANKYVLNTWLPAVFPGTAPITPTGNSEAAIRPAASAAVGLAAALSTGAYSSATTGVSTAAARATCARIVSGLAASHIANGSTWGNSGHPTGSVGWQTAMWATRVGLAAWLTKVDLTEDDLSNVARMIAFEADRMLDWKLPYYRSPTGVILAVGDSKSEEVAWDAGALQLALVMMPEDTNASRWMAKLLEMGVASHARPADLVSTTLLNGAAPADLLNGSNVNADGTIVNHSIIHPDYMVSAGATLWGTSALFSAAGMRVPRSLLFNADVVYAALSTLNFSTGSGYTAPGGTIYIPNSGLLYYPQGNDWGTARIAHVALIDLLAARHGWDTGLSTPAATWAQLHLQRQADLQARGSTGQTYQTASEDTYSGREQWVAHMAGMSLIALYAPAPAYSSGAVSSLIELSRGGGAVAVDITPPTVPATPTAVAGPGSATVSTSASSDNVKVVEYHWYRAGVLIGTTSGPAKTEAGLPAGVPVSYTVSAVDAAGNESAQSAASNSVTPTTPVAGGLTVSDTFTRADTTTGLGVTDTAQAWLGGTQYRVLSNTARIVSGTNAVTIAYVDTATANGTVSASIKTSAGRTRAGLCLRTNGTDYLFVELAIVTGTNRVAIRKRVGGTSTDLAAAETFGLVAGQTYAVAAIAAGDTITLKIDGVTALTHTLSSGDATTFGSRTMHGLFANVSPTQDDQGTVWDAFAFAPPA